MMFNLRLGPTLLIWSGLVVVLALSWLVAPAAERRPYDRIVVFGTSISDSGNVFELLGGHNTPPAYDLDTFLVPHSAFSRGGHHLSNGSTWIEQLARPIGLAGSVQPSFRTQGVQGTNYAVGGARSVPTPGFVNLPDQVGFFLRDFGGVAPAGALYVVEMGPNDILDALDAIGRGQDGEAMLDAAVLSISDTITTLYNAGARQFFVGNSANLGNTPAVRAFDQTIPGTSTLAMILTVGFNTGLSTELDALDALPGIEITRMDAFGLFVQVVANPPAFGLTNVRDACITSEVPPFTCRQPDDYLFWDGVHPTTAAHGVIAREAALLLGLDQ